MLTASMPAAFRASIAVGVVRKWYVLGSSVPRDVIAVSRLTIVRSAADSWAAIGPNAVAGSLSSFAVRSMKCTSPANTSVRSTGAGDAATDREAAAEAGAGEGDG